jgi:hypothetical protein
VITDGGVYIAVRDAFDATPGAIGTGGRVLESARDFADSEEQANMKGLDPCDVLLPY